jgi:hypothetical protein
LYRVLLAAGNSGILVIFLAVVLVAGYLVLWAIWHFGFRDRDDDGRRRRPPQD